PPAGMSSTTVRRTGASRVAPAMSSERTANPSIPLLSQGGWSIGDIAGSARTRPKASTSGTGSAAVGRTAARILSSASGMESQSAWPVCQSPIAHLRGDLFGPVPLLGRVHVEEEDIGVAECTGLLEGEAPDADVVEEADDVTVAAVELGFD